MSDRTRQGLAFVIAMGMVIAVASVPTVAQEVTGDRFEVAAINAHTVDGKHAVSSSTSRARRAGKLVATNSKGLLPGNIVRPYWSNVKGKPAGFADGVDDIGYIKKTWHSTTKLGPGERRTFDWLLHVSRIPTCYVLGGSLRIDDIDSYRIPDGRIAHDITVRNTSSAASSAAELRCAAL
jgi:hypothetical protein